MKTVMDKASRNELSERIQKLSTNSKARWGKMHVFQMARHCTAWSEWVLGKGGYVNFMYQQDWLGKIFGKWALKSNTKDDQPMKKKMPAGRHVVSNTVSGNLETEKSYWIQLLHAYASFENDRFVHDFFGAMSREQIGIFAYKHFDHHLRQFGV